MSLLNPQVAFITLLSWARARMLNEDGAVATEYVLLLTFIAIAIIAVVIAFGGRLTGLFNTACSKLVSGATNC